MTMLDLDTIEPPSTVEDVERLYFAVEEMEDGMDPAWLARAAELKAALATLLYELTLNEPRH